MVNELSWVWRNLTTGNITQTYEGNDIVSGVPILYPAAPRDTLGSLRTLYENSRNLFSPALASIIQLTGWNFLRNQSFGLTKHSGEGLNTPVVAAFVGNAIGSSLRFPDITPFITSSQKDSLYGVWYNTEGCKIGEIFGLPVQFKREWEAITKNMTSIQIDTLTSLTSHLKDDDGLILGYFNSDPSDLEAAVST